MVGKLTNSLITNSKKLLCSGIRKSITFIKTSVAPRMLPASVINYTSPLILEENEKKILCYLSTSYKDLIVEIKNCSNNSQERPLKIRTLIFNENSDKIPIVMVHGLLAAGGLWGLNIDTIANSRPVYVIDLLGFGRSSRPTFSKDAAAAEFQHVAAIEAWREVMKLERFIMLGHSLGGFLSTSYSLKYPERVVHLILADPWGFAIKPSLKERVLSFNGMSILINIMSPIAERVNPICLVRALGPWGPYLLKKLLPCFFRKFAALNQDGKASIIKYLFHSACRYPSGEESFRTMMDQLIYAKRPMANRIHELKPDLPITVIYGEKSSIKQMPDHKFRLLRANSNFLEIYRWRNAGHMIFADEPTSFNNIVSKAGLYTDKLVSY